MKIVPVIDLRAGQVVRAQRGQRATYRPLSTPLADNSHPSAVLHGLASLYRFDSIYVADLDAIQDCGEHHQILQTLVTDFPDKEFWVDAGRLSIAMTAAAPDRLRPVLGSESHSMTAVTTALQQRPDAILSLDFSAESFLGEAQLLQANRDWPENVIIMCLDRIGSGEGPDFNRFAQLISSDKHRHYYAGGGIRHDADLHELAGMKIHGALIATALHQGSLRSCRRGG